MTGNQSKVFSLLRNGEEGISLWQPAVQIVFKGIFLVQFSLVNSGPEAAVIQRLVAL